MPDKAVLLTLFFLVFGAGNANSANLKVLSSSDDPNYGHEKGKSKVASYLTDGATTSYPMWNNEKSLGWRAITPVELRLDAGRPFSAGSKILVHTSKGEYAEVYPPRRIDVYCITNSGNSHLASEIFYQSQLIDRRNHWLSVKISQGCNGRFNVVLHATGPYVMIDEIRLEFAAKPPQQSTAQKSQAFAANAVSDTISHSTGLLRASLQRKSEMNIKKLVSKVDPGGVSIFVKRPWGRLSLDFANNNSAEILRNEKIFVEPDGKLDFVVALVNSSGEEVRAKVNAYGVRNAEVFYVEPVLTANGNTVYDPIIPTNLTKEVRLSPLTTQYLLLRTNGLTNGSRDVRVVLKGQQGSLRKEVRPQVTVLPSIPDERVRPPYINLWSYSSDFPIWNNINKHEMLDELVAAGVNVFVIHPSRIPSIEKPKDSTKITAFKKELALYKERGVVLLFLGLRKKLKQMDDKRFGGWIKSLSEIMQAENYGEDEWAFYPLDEAKKEHAKEIVRLTQKIKRAVKVAPIYVNPNDELFSVLSSAEKQQIFKNVSYWQPSYSGGSKNVKTLLNHSKGEFWVYENQVSPNKEVIPGCYRAVGPNAHRIGATGFGLWSFSDTGKSSAYNDFDGRRPDWAMVYEGKGKGPFVSSRRWEAFKRGIVDYHKLASCSIQGSQARKECQPYIQSLVLRARVCNPDAPPKSPGFRISSREPY